MGAAAGKPGNFGSSGLWRALAVVLAVAGLSAEVPKRYLSRPAAAPNGDLPSPPVQFSDATRSAAIDFVHFKSTVNTSTILEEAGPGVCVADYDGDGYQDIYFVNGRDLYNRGIVTRNALYHNNGDGTFTDVTEKAGVPGNAYGLGCVWGDYDNDGHPDLYVTQYGKDILYHNNGDGTFTDVTDKAGVGGLDFGTMFHTGATFFDYDRDGRLDLYVGGYANFSPASQQYCTTEITARSSCPPAVYGGTPDVLYHNNGDGTFTNVTKAAKIYQPKGVNLSVGAADYDNDGWPDLFVANDGVEAYLYHNNHDGTFTNVAMESGIALTADGNTMAAMCISLGDFENDGNLGLYISDFQGAGDHMWHYNGKGSFDEVSDQAGITVVTKKVLSFGGGFFDYDNDGWLDLFIANGHVYPEIDHTSTQIRYKEINSLFHNDHDGRFTEVSQISGNGFAKPFAGRGVAFVDYDNDGYVDLVVANNGDPPLLLHNDGPASGGRRNHFANFKLVGTHSNRDAMGARLKLRAGGVSQVREIAGGGSYLSQSDLRANFGLGQCTVVDELEVRWPSGSRQVFRNLAADKFYLIVEGEDRAQRQRFTPTHAP
ncbi:MAG TPA: CRTAC1 family protein [Terriglobia bacterium]